MLQYKKLPTLALLNHFLKSLIMAQLTQTRAYPMADADLKQKADGLAATLTRDLADLGARNINAASVTAFRVLIATFDSTTSDEELLGELKAATDAKDAFAENIKKAIRPIRNMAELVYESKGKYTSFGFEDMANMSDSDVYRLAKRVVRVGTKFLADLAPQGLTAAQLTSLLALATSLDTAIDDVEDKTENRDIETQDRIKKGNALWKEMTKLSSVGKSVYEDNNEAKYNDYVLIPSSITGEPTTPENNG